MFDAAVTFEDRETVHRVIVGREYYEDFGLEAQEVVAMAFRFLLARRVPRQTEGAQQYSRVWCGRSHVGTAAIHDFSCIWCARGFTLLVEWCCVLVLPGLSRSRVPHADRRAARVMLLR